MAQDSMLQIIGLSKSYGGKKVVDDLHLQVKKGEIWGFLGPNGAGKTTTIKMMLHLVYPDQGQVLINGHDVYENFLEAIQDVGALVESPKLYSSLTGYRNLALMANLVPEITKERIDEVLELVGLKGREGEKVKHYSLGMKQRLGIARALLHHPKLVILDEPTNGLDPQGMREIRELIQKLAHDQKITFFISSHLLHEVEMMCDRVGILNQGKLIAQGRVDELLNSDKESIQIFTPSVTEAVAQLEPVKFIDNIEKGEDHLVITLDKGHSAKINQLLVENQIKVDYLIPCNNSLEKFFIDLTEEVEQVV